MGRIGPASATDLALGAARVSAVVGAVAVAMAWGHGARPLDALWGAGAIAGSWGSLIPSGALFLALSRDPTAWRAWLLAGRRGRDLAPALLWLSVATAVFAALGVQRVEPACAAALARRWEPRSGLGGAWGTPPEGVAWRSPDGRFAAEGDDGMLMAASSRWVHWRGDVALELIDVAGVDGQGWRMTAERARLPVPTPRWPLAAQLSSDLRVRAERSEAEGRDATTEHLVRHRRSAWPLLAASLIWLAVPMALRGDAWRRWGFALPLVLAVALRASDLAAPAVGAVVMGWLPSVAVGACAVAAWLGWRDV